MNRSLQLAGLVSLALLAAIVLGLLGYTLYLIGAHITPDGRIPSSDAFGFTALSLTFRELIAAIRSIWDTEARNNLSDKLAASTPQAPPAIDAPADLPNVQP